MIDYGLVVSLIAAFGIPTLLADRWPLTAYTEPTTFVDAVLPLAFAGLVVGRLTTLALDDPSSIGSISDMLVIRSGVEFWPAAAAAATLAAWQARRAAVPITTRLTDLVPLAVIGYASYEAACIFRDGCLGPQSPVGLRPPGLSTVMFPVGLAMAAVLAAVAIGLHAYRRRHPARISVVALAAAAVALVRSVGSIWLPHVGDGITRQHLTSIVIALAAVAATAGAIGRDRRINGGVENLGGS